MNRRNYFKPLHWSSEDTAEFTYRGCAFRARLEADTAMGAPWEEGDGHGPVSEWTRRAKLPGELVLIESGYGQKLFYDFAEAVKIARRDGWDAPPCGTGTSGQKAARAARSDFNRLKRWCNDEWHWVGVIVCRLDSQGEEREPSESLWGIESDAGDYLSETAYELARQCMDR